MTPVALALLVAAAPAASPQNDIVHSTAVSTPHVAWAKQLPGGPIRSFFITPIARGRDMAELMQRLALDATTVSIDREWDVNCWGIGDYYGHEARGDRDDLRIVYGYVEKQLTGDARFEVMVIPGLNGWSRLTRASRDAILRRVREGAGLVLIHPFVGDVKAHPFAGDEPEGDTRIWDLSPLVGVADDFVNERGYWQLNEAAVARGRWQPAARHFITDGLPLDLIPSGDAGGRVYKYEAKGDVLIQAGGHPVVAVKSFGKGRVVALGYVEDGFLPEGVDPVETKVFWDYWEYQYALLARSVLWAAGREGDVAVGSLRATADAGVELTLEAKSEREVQVEIGGKSAFGTAMRAQALRRALTAGSNVVALPAASLRPESGWSGGRQVVDVVVKDANGAALNWGAAAFDVPKPAVLTALRAGAPVYRQGDLMSVLARAAGDLASLRLRLSVRDDLGRTLAVQEKPTRGETYFFVSLDNFLGREALLTAELVDGAGRVVDQAREKPILVVQAARRRGDYVAYLSFEESRHFLAPTRRGLLAAEAIEPGFTWSGDVNNDLGMPRGYFGVYWYDRGPTTPEAMEKAIAEFQNGGDVDSLDYLTKKELYKRTGDTRFLVRKPSLDDPEVLARLAGVARSSARTRSAYNMDYYFVGDEGSLTSYSDAFDFCWGPHTLANFRKWLESQYGSLEALNGEWGSAFKAWDDVMPSTTTEARRTRLFAPWADHRTYMEVSFANAYRIVRDAVREGDPDGHIALSGTQATSPYNGCDWYRLDKVIDHYLSYGGGNQWELHRSFAKPGSLLGFWTGYGSSGVGVRHQIWTAALTGVLHPNLFWSYSVVNPDLTLSKSARDMGAVFKALRFEGVGRLLMEAQRVGDGVAIHYSMPSVHAAGILGLYDRSDDDDSEKTRASRFPAARDGWVRALTDLGLSPDFLASEQVESGALAAPNTRVFILPNSLAVSADEVKALEQFASSGGIVIADGYAGLYDQHVALRREGMLNALFGIAAPPSERRDTTAKPVSGPVVVTPAGASWGVDAGKLAGLAVAEPGVRAHGGEPLLKIGGVDAVVARRVGKGWAVYLNLGLDAYPEQRRKGYGGGAYRDLLSPLLAHLGVRPAVEVRDPSGRALAGMRVTRYRFGEREVVALLRESLDVEKDQGRDGVTTFGERQLDREVGQRATVHMGRTAHLANVRSGEVLGNTDTVVADLVPGEALILSSGAAAGALKASGPAVVSRGEPATFALHLDRDGRHLVRVHVFDPDGRFLPEYARNVLVDGRHGSFVLPSALSDAAGRYRLQAVDILTGTDATTNVLLK